MKTTCSPITSADARGIILAPVTTSVRPDPGGGWGT